MESDVPQLRETALYRTLSQTFPQFRTQQQRVLDVEGLAKAIGMTEEGLYKWLRAGRILSRRGVERIHELAHSPDNVERLQECGRTPPTKQELASLMLA
jgi:hypothetical protein